jgi:AP2-like factor (euAP2 lineage)
VEVPLSSGMVAIVDEEDYERVTQFKWSYHSLGYAFRGYGSRENYKYQYLHRFILRDPSGIVDHINNDRLDCRKSNLRVTDKSGNAHNPRHKPLGVYWDKKRRNWVARIKVRGRPHYLGRFTKKSDALLARKQAEVRFNLSLEKTCDSL